MNGPGGRSLAALLAVWGAGLLPSCSLVVDASAVSAGCPSGEKACFGGCVPLTSTEFGCAGASCSPCAPKNAQALCDPAGACVVAACLRDWQDCDGDSSNGCESNANDDELNCGGCGKVCDTPRHGSAACGNASCYVHLCEGSFEDCNFRFADGCEVDLAHDPDNCGECGRICDATCQGGECVSP